MEKVEMIRPYPGMKIYTDVSFFPGVYNFYKQDGIEICASNITIHGNGCVFIGGKEKEKVKSDTNKEEFSYGYGNMIDTGLGYHGYGIYMKGVSNVTIENLQVRGFVNGLYMEQCSHCKIQENDFSYNYHNPAWGWDEHADVGGILLHDSHYNVLKNNKAINVWSALVLRFSDHNQVIHNDFSHTSNVGLRLWMASYNEIEDNDFSWGIRKEANEVHARDSSCVLIEAASHYNTFKRNDMRYGGDGLFIRSLNNMMSMYNVFEENDTSFANNNAIEAWDAHNTYIRNKANYSSYGFWLGCSDHTVLIENEVIGNGTVFQNAPESFGNAGIAVVNGSGNDFYLKGNVIMENQGPGIAIRNTQACPSSNWIIEKNIIKNNHEDLRGYHGYGIYLKNALNIHLFDNDISNDNKDIYEDENVSMIRQHEKATVKGDVVMDKNPIYLTVNEEALYRASGQNQYAYYFDDGFMAKKNEITRKFYHPGRYRMFINAEGEKQFTIMQQNIYVVPEGKRIKDLFSIDNWELGKKNTDISSIQRLDKECIRFSSKSLINATFSCFVEAFDIKKYRMITLLYCYMNDFIDWEKEVKAQVILHDETGGYMKIVSHNAIFQEKCQLANETKYEWDLLNISLYENDDFYIEYSDDFQGIVNRITWKFNTPQKSNLKFYIGDAILQEKQEERYLPVLNGKAHQKTVLEKMFRFSSTHEDQYEIFMGNDYQYDLSKRWISSVDTEEETIEICFQTPLPADGIEVKFYADYINSYLPEKIEFFCDDQLILTKHPQENDLKILFPRVYGEKYLLKMKKQNTKVIGIYSYQLLLKDRKSKVELCLEEDEYTSLKHAVVKINAEMWPKDKIPEPLHYQLFEASETDITASNCLLDKHIDFEDISLGKETMLPLCDVKVKKGVTYFLMLSKEPLANGAQDGSYYRWVGSGIDEINGNYGYWNDDRVIDHEMTGWGECYLKIYYDDQVYDHSTLSEGLGNRIGIKGMERMYQKFIVPRLSQTLINHDFCNIEGWPIKNKEVLIKTSDENIIIRCFLKNEDEVVVHLGEKSFKNHHKVLDMIFESIGWHKLQFESKGNELMRIEVLEDV